MKKLKKLKLSELSNVQLDENKISRILGGGSLRCACLYDGGGSSSGGNSGGTSHPFQCSCTSYPSQCFCPPIQDAICCYKADSWI